MPLRLRSHLPFRIRPVAARWAWDYPPNGAVIHGRTVVIDGRLAARGGVEMVAVVGERVVGTWASDDGEAETGAYRVHHFHLEAPVEPAADGTVTLTLGRRATPDTPLRTLATRTFRYADGSALPYEDAFRIGERRGFALGRHEVYSSGAPAAIVCDEMLARVRRHAGRRVLDLGCGAGPYARALVDDGRVVVGIERERPTASLALAAGVPVACADGRRLPFRDGSFESVVAVEVLEHVPDPELVVRECARVSRGNLVVSVPNASVIPHLFPFAVVPWHMLEATHVNFFSAGTLKALLRTAFPHVRVGYYVRAFRFPGAPPLYAHLFAVAGHGRTPGG